MDLDTVRQCFKKFITYLETHEKIKIPVYSNDLSITEIDKITQIVFMDYVLNCNSNNKISQTEIPCVLYKHVNSLIRQYIQEDQNKPIVRVINVGSEKQELPKEVSKKGWFI